MHSLSLWSVLTVLVLSAGTSARNAFPQSPKWRFPDLCEVGKPVLTTSGFVQGHAAPNASTVSEYLGIPFAKPPVGELRFAPPVRYYGFGNLSGLSTGRVCPQIDLSSSIASNVGQFPAFLTALGGIGQERSEDCLTVNVWTKHEPFAKPKPVMVWIYGGGFATGSSNASAYSGQYWAEQDDVVFVNFNYRLGIFGFSGAPSLTQNVGLLDQRLAVEWVRDNAAAFGGDPSRIVLFGESAGAASTDYYNYAWTDDPIIAGSIAESGEANAFGNKRPDIQESRWYTVAESVGCGNLTVSTADEIVACMRDTTKVPTANLTSASIGSGPLSLILSNFGPTVDNKTVFSNYSQRAIDGQIIKKPALVGNNINEAGIFTLIFSFFGIDQSPEVANVLTKSVFTCPSNSAANARHINDIPVWRYLYFPSFPNIQIPTSINRAYHLSEVFPLFGTDVDVSGQNSTAIERKLGSYMRGAWSAFAHDPINGLSKYKKWPEYSPDTNVTGLVFLGMDNSTGASFGARGPYDGDCPLFYQGIPPT